MTDSKVNHAILHSIKIRSTAVLTVSAEERGKAAEILTARASHFRDSTWWGTTAEGKPWIVRLASP